MEAKHTPGPWEYDAESEQIIAPKCGYQWTAPPTIARIVSLDYDEDDGNARLIAAAPDLLEALRKIAAIEDKMFGGDWDEIEEARMVARAAIARATGEQA
jgi:hypothetical protein